MTIRKTTSLNGFCKVMVFIAANHGAEVQLLNAKRLKEDAYQVELELSQPSKEWTRSEHEEHASSLYHSHGYIKRPKRKVEEWVNDLLDERGGAHILTLRVD